MPIYEYHCDACDASYEVFQKMSDDPLETCERCGGKLRKVLFPVAIHFKGSGFYTTDYGKGSGRPVGNREARGSEGDGGSAEKPADSGAKAAEAKPKAKEKQKTS